MATCPSGHESASDDYCDVCGTLIGTAVLTSFAQAPGSTPGQAPGGVSPAEGACPRCGVPRVGQFCESCGFDFNAAARARRHRRCQPAYPADCGAAGKPNCPRRPHRPR